MPLTLAHPAAILPLFRPLGRWAVPSALVLGSMSPDFAYFLPGTDLSTHSADALLWFDLPAGGLAYATWHALVARPLVALLPRGVAERLLPLLTERAAQLRPPVQAVAVSLLVGAATHLAWDSFTHSGTWLTDAVPLLGTELGRIGAYHVRIFGVLQHASTAVGCAVLALWALDWLDTAPGVPVRDGVNQSLRWLARATLVGLPGVVGAAWALTTRAGESVQAMAGAAVFASLPVGLVLALGWAGLWRLRFRGGS